MRRILQWAWFGAALAFILQGASGRAQDVRPQAVPAVSGPVYMEEAPPMGPGAGEQGSNPNEPRHFRRIHAWLRDHPCCCWATHNSPGCGSLQAECDFIFGSCRTYYNEPCRKVPAPPPYPPLTPGYPPSIPPEARSYARYPYVPGYPLYPPQYAPVYPPDRRSYTAPLPPDDPSYGHGGCGCK
jgi:hypothetical protein